MKLLELAECLETHFVRVSDRERPSGKKAGLFAVFSGSVEEGPFLGLLPAADALPDSGLTFADLLAHRPVHAVPVETPVRQALQFMDGHDFDALPVQDAKGTFLGFVTRKGILLRLLQREELLFEESARLHLEIEKDKTRLAAWSEKLAELHEASRALLDVLAHTSLEADLLQHGIEAMTRLLQAKYGAIGLLGESGELQHFHHSGLSPEIVLEIGHFPEGKGLLGAVIEGNSAIRIADIGNDPRSTGFPPGHPAMQTLLALPIAHAGHVYGRIYLCDKLDGSTFTESDERLALSFSASLSLLLENARELRESRHAQQHLDYLAHFDTLTGLPNRELLTDRIRQLISHSLRYNRKMALLFVDVDNFKSVNDTYGHPAGDELLKSVADIISFSLREEDTLARLGGDEFVILLPEIAFAQDAASVAEKIVHAMKEPIKLKDTNREICISVSIGISLYPQDGVSIDTLMSNADTAMYYAKSAGKNTFQFFTSSLNRIALLHLKLEQYLRQALSHRELKLYYQPQIHLESGKIIGVETLLRWESRHIGEVSPADFIPIAEETGLIVPIGAWVLKTACAQGAQWHREGFSIRIAVNVSPKQFHHDQYFLQTIQSALEETGLPPRLLELEITESLMVQKFETTLAMLGMIRALGVRFFVDDFGTGYSSLSYLKRLPIDGVKIDQAFVRDIVNDRNDAAIVAAIMAMARQLDLEVIVEGVETKEQLEFIRTHQCDAVQGHYFGKSVQAEEMKTLLQSGIRMA